MTPLALAYIACPGSGLTVQPGQAMLVSVYLTENPRRFIAPQKPFPSPTKETMSGDVVIWIIDCHRRSSRLQFTGEARLDDQTVWQGFETRSGYGLIDTPSAFRASYLAARVVDLDEPSFDAWLSSYDVQPRNVGTPATNLANFPWRNAAIFRAASLSPFTSSSQSAGAMGVPNVTEMRRSVGSR